MLKKALPVLAIVAVLSNPFFFIQIYARSWEPSVTLARAGQKDSLYTGFIITTPTRDGGRVDVIFAWEMASRRMRGRESDPLRVYDTYPTLQMVKFTGNGSLDYSLTYIPLYLIQFDDTNENGLFDVRTQRTFAREVSDEEVNWNLSRDRTLRMYPLTPMFSRFQRGEASNPWSWRVSDPTKAKPEGALEYVWSASALVKSFGWRFIDNREKVEEDSVNVSFGYRLTLKPEGPTAKLEYGIEGLKWASGKDVKLALISAVLYHGRDEVVVKEMAEYEGFSGASAKDRRVALVERAGESVKSFVAYSSDAVIDGAHQTGVITSALQPVFVVSTPSDVPEDMPEGVNVRGVKPSFDDKVIPRHSVVFAHQLAFPRFESKVFQDPAISLVALLLLPEPSTFVTPQLFIMLAATISVIYALLKVALRRSLRYPFAGSSPHIPR